MIILIKACIVVIEGISIFLNTEWSRWMKKIIMIFGISIVSFMESSSAMAAEPSVIGVAFQEEIM